MESFVSVLTIFMLASFVGWMVITKVPPLLHTPLMSGTNAVSGITIIGAMIAVSTPDQFTTILGFFAIVFATVNVVGGFPRDESDAEHVQEEGLRRGYCDHRPRLPRRIDPVHHLLHAALAPSDRSARQPHGRRGHGHRRRGHAS